MKYKELLYKGWCQKKGSNFLDQMEGWSFKNYEKKEEMFAIPPFPQKKSRGGINPVLENSGTFSDTLLTCKG